MAFQSDVDDQLYCDVNCANKIPIPWPNPVEKVLKKDELDVPDISQSFLDDNKADQAPHSKQYRRMSHPKEPTSYLNSHRNVFTCQNDKIKHVEKPHYEDGSTKLDDEKHCCFSKREDNYVKESQNHLKTMHPSVSSESDLWDYLKRQDAKLDAIQEQVSRALMPSQSPKITDISGQKEVQSTDAILPVLGAAGNESEAAPRGLSRYQEDLLIKCLLSQGEQIQKLQEQVNWLMLNVSGSDKLNSCPLNMEVPNIASSRTPDMLEGFLKRVDNQNSSPSHKDIEVSKQSTSTMTSMTFNGNEKFLIHKKLTVVTDSSKYQKEVSAQCSYISNGVNTPLNLTPTKNASTSVQSSPIKPQKSTKSAKKNLVTSGSLDVVSPKEMVNPSPVRIKSPSGEKANEKTAKVGITESNIVKYLPNYQNILKNVNEVIGENANQPVLPTKKTTPKETSKPKSKKSPLPKTSPLQIKENEKQPCKCFSSDSSQDSTYNTPKSKKKRTPKSQPETTGVENESYMKARYGLSSPNLSVATIQYLESYGLVRDKLSEPRKKSRTSLPKRYTN